ncbi:Uncharacterized protein ToN1_44070 [Aromatoleum petrolei]|nr:Uncharacterized protein ToN1_44070 [Aromatoleum petrolei]
MKKFDEAIKSSKAIWIVIRSALDVNCFLYVRTRSRKLARLRS